MKPVLAEASYATPSQSDAAMIEKKKFVDSDLDKIIIRVGQQKLYLYRGDTLLTVYPVSTSRHGVGNKQDSLCTPLGTHYIAEKIGHGCEVGEIIKNRVATGNIAKISKKNESSGEDIITSRILWLQGEEPGINSGAGVDSYQRYIYIHGTNEEGLIGRPASIGCIRMKNEDVIDLFNEVETGTHVFIVEN